MSLKTSVPQPEAEELVACLEHDPEPGDKPRGERGEEPKVGRAAGAARRSPQPFRSFVAGPLASRCGRSASWPGRGPWGVLHLAEGCLSEVCFSVIMEARSHPTLCGPSPFEYLKAGPNHCC